MADSIEHKERLRAYTEELPPDNAKAWKLLESYSKIPHNEVEAHLRAMVSCHQVSSAKILLTS
jgi:hypothetical protein